MEQCQFQVQNVVCTNGVHVQELFYSSVSSMHFGNTGQWFKVVFISLFIFLTAPTHLPTWSSKILSLREKLCVTRSLSTDHKNWSQHPEGQAKSSLTWCQPATMKCSGCRWFIFSLMSFSGSIKYTVLSTRWFLWHCLQGSYDALIKRRGSTHLWSLVANKQLLPSLEEMYVVDEWHTCPKTARCSCWAYPQRHWAPVKTL